VIPFLLVDVLELTLSTQGKGVALKLDVDVVGVDLGQLDLQRDALAVLEDIDERRPAAACALGFFVRLFEMLFVSWCRICCIASRSGSYRTIDI